MINTEVKKVIEIVKDVSKGVDVQIVKFADNSQGYNYPTLIGRVEVGDEVFVNTTAVDLNLGTGGYHFIISKLNPTPKKDKSPGHIMKLRYTPLQLKVHTLEEQLGENLDKFSFSGHKVITIELHSMLAPLVIGLKKINPHLKITYCMTDGGALPAYHSNTLKILKENKLIQGVITCGHAFGGDLESVNFITAIQGSIAYFQAQITIVGMGPGIVGTGTKYGFTGIEQGYISDVAQNLGCDVYPALRLGFADQRERHRGISHHFLTNFGSLVKGSYPLVLPDMERKKITFILTQLKNEGLTKKHSIKICSKVDILKEAEDYGINLSSMGRGYDDNPEYFDALTALAKYVAYSFSNPFKNSINSLIFP
ncbi:DUF3866 family protein [Anaerobranca gottschalkii]|uniref:DUF3866 domain-containing protein n=1 Tax=Anaerobranca gottschalkii DSM 13577 TaxID=1120990 RepID=A0A1H9Y1D8_9FIRM|nr:DUF3866 family protein [Anaerobranca gottschalkii]SES62517.1 Protein of unknown function [Anaerobranca gottschalkii DSM 13577]